MSRYVRLNTLPGFTGVASFYWYDSRYTRVLSFTNQNHLFDPNIDAFDSTLYTIGSPAVGDVRYVRYNFVMNNGYKQSAQLRKIMRAYKFSAREITNKDKCLEVAAQKEDAATVAMPDAKPKFAIINMSNYTLAAHDQDEATARENIERWVRDDGGEYMLVREVAIAKPRNAVVWSDI